MTQLKDVLHFYIGCAKYRFRVASDKSDKWSLWWDLKGSDHYNIINDSELSEIQLLLRRLSDMTEEECEDVAKILGDRPTMSKEALVFQVKLLFEQWYNCTTSIPGYRWMKISFFLIKQGFDLFGLIDSKQAIDAKTLQL